MKQERKPERMRQSMCLNPDIFKLGKDKYFILCHGIQNLENMV